MDKPQKPTDLLPSSFGGIKRNFSEDLQQVGYEPDVPTIFGGANLNFMLDGIGKNFEYNNAISDFVNGLPINNIITVDENNKLVYKNANEFGANTSLSNLTEDGENHFANPSLSNLTSDAQNMFYGPWNYTSIILLSDYSLKSGASYTADLSSILPDDGCDYDVRLYITGSVTYNSSCFIYGYTDILPEVPIWRGRSFSSSATLQSGVCPIFEVGTNRTLTIHSTSLSTGTYTLALGIKGYRRIPAKGIPISA